ncbi:GNAT family N-acetyltransferase [Kribbella speibonae]|uniref:GNAT family N-acetyltransferase n=1 Tax=Kribbella speibonae TaxID=1572660 RepID=A0A4R0JAL6_9ACTN|nr:GNAT family N-acetyltransferase [Kribbella speibonae]TCC26473.1 GNAT family N-acetyltransferase [Kribbella speibonae]TCC38575.1 GNAT family N-acetyltransferase [Kribbella speibonae]
MNLRNPVYAALTGPHASFAEVRGNARRYPSAVAPFLALPEVPTEQDWADAAVLVGSGTTAALMRPALPVPDSFKLELEIDLVQFVAPDSLPAADPEAVVLGADDVPEMLALVALTDPGPFRSRTIELGTYLGVRRDGELIAMAGTRFALPGHTEISAVCTHPSYQGQGLASRLIRAVAHRIESSGRTPFLHTGAANTAAIRLYRSLGFTLSNEMKVTVAQAV